MGSLFQKDNAAWSLEWGRYPAASISSSLT